MMTFVMPVVMSGMLEILRSGSKDPVDDMAEYLRLEVCVVPARLHRV